MYLILSFYEYSEHEWDDECREHLLRETAVPLKSGVVDEAPEFEVTDIGTGHIVLRTADSRHVGYGTFSTGTPGHESPGQIHRPCQLTLPAGRAAEVSDSWSYNGSTHGRRVLLRLMEGDLEPPPA